MFRSSNITFLKLCREFDLIDLLFNIAMIIDKCSIYIFTFRNYLYLIVLYFKVRITVGFKMKMVKVLYICYVTFLGVTYFELLF